MSYGMIQCMNQREYYAIGTMSGTSMDGVDVALIRTDGESMIESIGHVSLSYPADLQLQLKQMAKQTALCAGDITQARLQCAHWDEALQQLSQYHADAIADLIKRYPMPIDVIGFHGQTLFHAPADHLTVQVGLADWLAKQFNCALVHQFRLQDVALGGQGAPLAPAYHQALVLRDHLAPAVVINCGGISNATVVEGEGWQQVCASDLGPGNGLIDRLVTQVSNGQQHYDCDGLYAKRGQLDQALLAQLWSTAIQGDSRHFVDRPWPKSLDIHDLRLPENIATDGQAFYDACYTLTYFTTDVIVQSLLPILYDEAYRFILCGGGWNNPVMLASLQRLCDEHLPDVRLQLSAELNWHAQAVEPEIFAYLAVRRLRRLPASGPHTTGVPSLCVAGELVLAD